MKNIKFSAWDKVSREVREVAAINWIEEIVLLWAVRGSARCTVIRDFDQIKLLLETHGTETVVKEVKK